MITPQSIEQAKKEITAYLRTRDRVLFAYLFGSAAKNKRFRDIDVGIFMEDGVELMELGGMQADLDGMFSNAVDLVPINKLPVKKPVLAFNIVTEGELLFTRDEAFHVEYKKKAMLQYFDTLRLRDKVNKAFENRLENGMFGKRNFSGEDVA